MKFASNWQRFVCAVVITGTCALMVACGGGNDGAVLPPPVTTTLPAVTPSAAVSATLRGTVSDAANGAGIAGVEVSVGGLNTTTSATGAYTLPVTTGTLVVSFRKAGFVEQTKVNTDLNNAGDIAFLNVPLLAFAQSTVLTGTGAQTVTVAGSTAAVALPADGLRRTDGSAAQGAITVNLTPINPAVNVNTMPGSLVTLVNGVTTPIESFGALNVTIVDAAGAPLNLRSGQSATIRIPAVTRGAALPASIPLFNFNATTGQWVQEGTATLVGSGAAAFYQGSVAHFSTWNADQVVNTVFINGCVIDSAGVRVAGARVTTEGINYVGTASVQTNAQGNFRIAVKTNSLAALTASASGRAGSSVSVASTTVEQTISTCLTLVQVGGNAGGVTIKLSWGALPRDLDSHLWAPTAAGVVTGIDFTNLGDLNNSPFVNLDVDDVSSFGPEFVTINKIARSTTYRYWVNNFSNSFTPGQTGSPARVEVNVGGSLTTFSPPAGEGNNLNWHAFDIVVDANCNIAVVPVNAWLSAEPAAPVYGTARSYCN